jgi:hypothetical protein
VDEDEVLQDLIEHDGYDPMITVAWSLKFRYTLYNEQRTNHLPGARRGIRHG